MKSHFKLLSTSLVVALSFVSPQATYAMQNEDLNNLSSSQIHQNQQFLLEENNGKEFRKSGLFCLQKGNIGVGIQDLQEAVRLNDIKAISKLAIMYKEGLIVDKNLERALQLYEKLIELKHAPAKNEYIALSEKLIKKGNIDAMINLANHYMSEEEVSEETQKKAFELYDMAVEREDLRAMKILPQMYEKYYFDNTDNSNEEMALYSNNTHSWEGEGSVFYKIKALMLYKKAMDLGDEKAKDYLNQLCKKLTLNFQKGSESKLCINGSRINQQAGLLTTYLVQGNSISDLKQFDFLESFLEVHYINVCPFYVRGWMYENGYGVKQDIIQAFENYFDIKRYREISSDWNRIAKKAHDAVKSINDPKILWLVANRSLLARYEPEQTRKLFERIIQEAPDEKHPKGSALGDLAYMYEKGIGAKKNIEKAKKLYKQAFDLGDEDARRIYEKLSNPTQSTTKVDINIVLW